MDYKKLLEEIKFVLGKEKSVETIPTEPVIEEVKVELKDINTMDGKVLSIDTLEIGGKVTLEGEPAVGEFVIETGETIITDETGTITEIKPKEEVEAPEEEPAPVSPEMSLEEKFNQLESRLTKLEELLISITEGFKKTEAEYQEKFEKLSEQPKSAPIFAEKQETKPMSKSEARIIAFGELQKMAKKNNI